MRERKDGLAFDNGLNHKRKKLSQKQIVDDISSYLALYIGICKAVSPLPVNRTLTLSRPPKRLMRASLGLLGKRLKILEMV